MPTAVFGVLQALVFDGWFYCFGWIRRYYYLCFIVSCYEIQFEKSYAILVFGILYYDWFYSFAYKLQLSMFFRSSLFSQCSWLDRSFPQLYFMSRIQSSTWLTLYQFLEREMYRNIPNYIIVKVYRSDCGRMNFWSILNFSRCGQTIIRLDEWFSSRTQHLLFSCSILQSFIGHIIISSRENEKLIL